MNSIGEFQAWAAGRVLNTGVVSYQRGCTILKLDVGIYRVTFDKECDKYEAFYNLTPEQSQTNFVLAGADSGFTVNVINGAGVNVDKTFHFNVFKLSNQNSADGGGGGQNV